MAAAVRLSNCRVAVAGVGAFGLAVADALPFARVPSAELADADADVLVLALWRPAPALLEQLDERAFATGRAWLPIVAEHPHLLVGPWVQPPDGPCLRCYSARRAQHDTALRVTSGLHAAYDSDPTIGPAGYLPHHVRIAVGLTLRALTRREPGLVSAYDLHSGRLTTHCVVPVHGCARCDPSAEMGRRDGSTLAGALAGVRP